MTEANAPAYPVTHLGSTDCPGITKREYFAGLAMQGLLAKSNTGGKAKEYAADAVKAADALIAELSKPQP